MPKNLVYSDAFYNHYLYAENVDFHESRIMVANLRSQGALPYTERCGREGNVNVYVRFVNID